MIKSDIDDVIRYELVDFPPWREDKDVKSVTGMINEIVKFQDKWKDEVKDTIEVGAAETIKRIEGEMEVDFYFRVNKEEGHGLKTFEDTDSVIKSRYVQRTVSKSEQEVLNLYRSYEKLKDIGQKEATPLLDGEILKSIHKILLEGINKDGDTEPGNYSRGIRITVYKGEEYKYKNIKDLTLEQSVQTILDRYNDLIDKCKSNWQSSLGRRQDTWADLFKIGAYLLFEMLDVHPFADGNGRLCRMLVSYALSFATPFPSSVYNIWRSDDDDITNKDAADAYIDAIVATRRSVTRHPHLLAAMIAECNWYAWRKFFERLNINI